MYQILCLARQLRALRFSRRFDLGLLKLLLYFADGLTMRVLFSFQLFYRTVLSLAATDRGHQLSALERYNY